MTFRKHVVNIFNILQNLYIITTSRVTEIAQQVKHLHSSLMNRSAFETHVNMEENFLYKVVLWPVLLWYALCVTPYHTHNINNILKNKQEDEIKTNSKQWGWFFKDSLAFLAFTMLPYYWPLLFNLQWEARKWAQKCENWCLSRLPVYWSRWRTLSWLINVFNSSKHAFDETGCTRLWYIYC